jgi:hypothetical protein
MNQVQAKPATCTADDAVFGDDSAALVATYKRLTLEQQLALMQVANVMAARNQQDQALAV